ncbi:MAG: hypothetical protein QM756_31470 [Polyangiaceae bacterium]
MSNLVRDARDRTSALLRVYHAAGKPGPLELPLPVTLDPTLAQATLLAQKDELDRIPDRRAPRSGEARAGSGNVWAAARRGRSAWPRCRRALRAGHNSAALVFQEQRPATRRDRAGQRASSGNVLGFFETSYDRSAAPGKRARTTCDWPPRKPRRHRAFAGRGVRFQ